MGSIKGGNMDLKMIHRRETLVITAIAIIHENGLQGLSTREVAKREGISESTIFKHFDSKNELVLAVLDHYSQYDEAIMKSTIIMDLTAKGKLLHFLDCYLIYYENYPEITAILQSYNNWLHDKELKEKVLSIVREREKNIRYFVDQALTMKEINSMVDSESLVNIITGTFQRCILKWRMQEFVFPLREKTLTSLELIMDAFNGKPADETVNVERLRLS
jgi:AcrR family transcriptional regulator